MLERTQRPRSPAIAFVIALSLPGPTRAAPGEPPPIADRSSPPSFRPASTLTRRDAATAIARLAGYDTTPPVASTFADVSPGDAQLGAIEAMWRQGLTSGCSADGAEPPSGEPRSSERRPRRASGERPRGPSAEEPPRPGRERRFCPDRPATRGQLAVMLARAFAIAPPIGGQHFSDVPSTHPDYAFIEGLAQAGLAEPCPDQPGNYCPDAPVTRGDRAAMLSRFLLSGVADRHGEPAPRSVRTQSVLPWTSRRNASSLVLSGRPLSRSSSSRDSPPTFWR